MAAGDIRLHPLTFREFYSFMGGDRREAFDEYAFYGGMPLVWSQPDDAGRMAYLKGLFTETYIKDIVERNKIRREDALSDVIDLLCSSVGSLTNPSKVANALNSKQGRSGENFVAANTVKAYFGHLQNAFLFSEARRWYDEQGVLNIGIEDFLLDETVV